MYACLPWVCAAAGQELRKAFFGARRRRAAFDGKAKFYIPQGGVQWKRGVVVYIIS